MKPLFNACVIISLALISGARANAQMGPDFSACPTEPTLRLKDAGFQAEIKAKLGSLSANRKWGQATVGSARIMYMSALQAEICRFQVVHNNSDDANTIGANILSEVGGWFDDIAAAMDEPNNKMASLRNANNTRRSELASDTFKAPKLPKIDGITINKAWTAPDYVKTNEFSASVQSTLVPTGLDAHYISKLASTDGTLLWAMQNINPKLRTAYQSGRTARDTLLLLFADVNALGQDILTTVPATDK